MKNTLEIYRSNLASDVAVDGGAIILDHASRTSEELDADVVALALALGWAPSDALALGDDADGIVPPHVDEDAWTDARAERLSWAGEDAVSWLSEHAAPEGTWIGHDGDAGALVCQTLDDECRHCGRTIVLSEGGWVDPEATGDDGIWHEVCDSHDTFTAEHEPRERCSVVSLDLDNDDKCSGPRDADGQCSCYATQDE